MPKQIIAFLLLLCMSMLTGNSASSNDGTTENIVTKYINLINDKQWTGVPDLWVKNQRDTLIDFFNSKQNKEHRIGLFNFQKAHLIAWKQIPYAYGKNYIPTRYIESFTSPHIFYVAVDYKVYREDKYHINGVNYFFIITVLDGGNRKIALTSHVPVDQIIRDGYGFGTIDEKAFNKKRLTFAQQ